MHVHTSQESYIAAHGCDQAAALNTLHAYKRENSIHAYRNHQIVSVHTAEWCMSAHVFDTYAPKQYMQRGGAEAVGVSESSEKGGEPQSRMYMSTPADQTSHAVS